MKNKNAYEHCYQGSVRETVAEFIDNSPLLNKYKDKEYYELEDSLVELIRTAPEKPKTTDRKVQNTIYMILFDWSTEDDCGIETYLYNDYDVAHKKFKGLVKDELDSEISWVGSRAVNRYGKARKGYILNYTDSGVKNTDAYFRVMAVKLMEQLGILKPYINGFKQSDNVCFFERFGGFWVYQEPEIQKKMKEIEKEYDCTVYAITHEFTEFGECYDFLIVSDYKEEWDDLIYKGNGGFYAFAYVWNKTDDYCSEFGTVGIKSFGGGITRIW